MNAALEKAWTDESQRLLAARDRFFDSLTAIKELADFAVTQVGELDRKRKFVIGFSRKNVEGLTEEENRVAAKAIGDLSKSVTSAIQAVSPKFPTPEEAPEEVREKLSASAVRCSDAVVNETLVLRQVW